MQGINDVTEIQPLSSDAEEAVKAMQKIGEEAIEYLDRGKFDRVMIAIKKVVGKAAEARELKGAADEQRFALGISDYVNANLRHCKKAEDHAANAEAGDITGEQELMGLKGQSTQQSRNLSKSWRCLTAARTWEWLAPIEKEYEVLKWEEEGKSMQKIPSSPRSSRLEEIFRVLKKETPKFDVDLELCIEAATLYKERNEIAHSELPTVEHNLTDADEGDWHAPTRSVRRKKKSSQRSSMKGPSPENYKFGCLMANMYVSIYVQGWNADGQPNPTQVGIKAATNAAKGKCKDPCLQRHTSRVNRRRSQSEITFHPPS